MIPTKSVVFIVSCLLVLNIATAKPRWHFASSGNKTYQSVEFEGGTYETIVVPEHPVIGLPWPRPNGGLKYRIIDAARFIEEKPPLQWEALQEDFRNASTEGGSPPGSQQVKGYRDFKRLQNGEAKYQTVEFDNKTYASIQHTKEELHLVPTIEGGQLRYNLTDADGKAVPFAGRPQKPAKKLLASAVEGMLTVTTAELRGENNTAKIKWCFAGWFERDVQYVQFNGRSYDRIIFNGNPLVSRPQVNRSVGLQCVSYDLDDMGKEVDRAFLEGLPSYTRTFVLGKQDDEKPVYEDAELLSSDDVNYVSVEYMNRTFRSIIRTPRLKELVPVVKGNNLTYTVYVHSREVEIDVSPHKVAEMLQAKTEDLQFIGLGPAVNRPRYVPPGVYSPRYTWPDVNSLPSISPGVYAPPGAQSPRYGEPRLRSYGSAAPRVNTVSWNVLLLLLSLAASLV